jgi:hypothetical protein
MNATSLPSPGSFDDPRSRGDFLPQYYPRANGKAAPPTTASERNDRIILEFLAAYYHLNCEYSRLVEVQKQPASPERNDAERQRLQAIEKVLIGRDGLEDRYAPMGVVVEPAVKDGFAVNLNISFGNIDAAGRRRSDLYTITAFAPVPLPKTAKFEDLVVSIQGPGISPS